MTTTPPRMLEGYKVLDFTQFVAGPTCTRILAEMGAEVIKVELAPAGDRVRGGGLKPLKPELKDSSASSYYLQHNHSKMSLAIDLKQPGARELVVKMLPKIDVLVENFAPGVIKRLGFDYETVKKIKAARRLSYPSDNLFNEKFATVIWEIPVSQKTLWA